jgi:hypothetical protein
MTDDKPVLVIAPEAQAMIDADPELAKVWRGFSEVMRNAMQGVNDGRYPSFDDAMEAMTGQRPERVAPPNPPKYGYFLSAGGPSNADGVMAMITDGHPKRGHTDFKIMAGKRFKTEAEAEAWFEEVVPSLPWREDDDA